jgi:hypothetical protein
MQGKPSKYDLSFDGEGNMAVADTGSGQRLEAGRAKSRNAEAPQRREIQDGGERPVYFERKDDQTCALRKRLAEMPKGRLDIRNNVEAAIFQAGYHYRGDKSRYRGLMKHIMWAVSRRLWVNFRRIQLWNKRKAENGENGEAGIPKGCFVLDFLRCFLRGYRFIFWPPVFAGSY